MALSPQDHAYYEEKLDVKGFIPYFIWTVVIGAILWPLMLFLMDWSYGYASNWTGQVVGRLMIIGFLLGSVVSVVMNFLFRFLLWMGWLPSRR
jgi:hypothetical protein